MISKIAVIVATLPFCAAGNIQRGGAHTLVPSATLTWEEVLQAQLHFLHKGDVRSCFAFASPQNKAQTGPLENFEKMLRSHYSTMIHSKWYSEQEIYSRATRTSACASVMIGKGSRVDQFEWCLSQQPSTAACSGCWMTDTVAYVSGYTIPPAHTVSTAKTTASTTTERTTPVTTNAEVTKTETMKTETTTSKPLVSTTTKTKKAETTATEEINMEPTLETQGKDTDATPDNYYASDNDYPRDHHTLDDTEDGHSTDHKRHEYSHRHQDDHHHWRHAHHHHDDESGYPHKGHKNHYHHDHHGHHHAKQEIVHETKTFPMSLMITIGVSGAVIIGTLVALIIFVCRLLRNKSRARISSETADKRDLTSVTVDVVGKPVDDDYEIVVVGDRV